MPLEALHGQAPQTLQGWHLRRLSGLCQPCKGQALFGVLVTLRLHCCSVQADQEDRDKVWTQTGCRTEAEVRRKTHGQGNPNALISDSLPYSPAPDCSKKAANSPRHTRGRHRGAQPAEKALPGDHILSSACVERVEAGVVTSLSTCGGQPAGREPALQAESEGGQLTPGMCQVC